MEVQKKVDQRVLQESEQIEDTNADMVAVDCAWSVAMPWLVCRCSANK
jgi:hypothetical protein